MAEEIGKLLSLEEHCRRRVDHHLEELLAEQDLQGELALRARAAADAIDQELHRHLEQVLELWQQAPVRRAEDGTH